MHSVQHEVLVAASNERSCLSRDLCCHASRLYSALDRPLCSGVNTFAPGAPPNSCEFHYCAGTRVGLILLSSARMHSVGSFRGREEIEEIRYLAIRGRISYTLSVELIVGWTRKMLPFCSGSILITSCLCRKDTRLSTQYILAFQESLGTRLEVLIWGKLLQQIESHTSDTGGTAILLFYLHGSYMLSHPTEGISDGFPCGIKISLEPAIQHFNLATTDFPTVFHLYLFQLLTSQAKVQPKHVPIHNWTQHIYEFT